jgi:hypothetical protein
VPVARDGGDTNGPRRASSPGLWKRCSSEERTEWFTQSASARLLGDIARCSPRPRDVQTFFEKKSHAQSDSPCLRRNSAQVLGSFDTPALATTVTVDKGVAYVPDGNGGLQVIDVSNPARPAFLGSFGVESPSYGVVVLDDVAHLVAGFTGLKTVDVQRCTFGACCIDETCISTLTLDDCVAVGGTYFGRGSGCERATCPEACPQDLDRSGAISFGDLLIILNSWGPCP